jgi:hypothetical protein
MSSGMNPLSASLASQVSSAYRLSTRQSGRSWSPAATASAGSGAGPAATVHLSTLPASVDADDRATYMALLKANQGNVGATLSALKASDSGEKDG